MLDEVTPEYEDKIQMYKVNIENEPDIAKNFGVRSIPYVTMISATNEKTTQLGVIDKDTLKYYFEGLISK